jgi:sugar O-acyltransferase (sialic acid O-acetyltransferase NeuD family)
LPNYIIVGTGDHGKVVLGYLERCGVNKENIAFVDIFKKKDEMKFGCQVIGDIAKGFESPFDFAEVIVAYGGNPYQGNVERQNASNAIHQVPKLNFRFATIIDPSAIVSQDSIIAGNVSVGINSIVGTDAKIHEGVIVNNMVNVEHDVEVKSYSNVSPNVALLGNVTIEERVFIGAGSIIRDEVTIQQDSVIAMGSVVTEDVLTKTLVGGNPAKVIRDL